MLVAIPPATAAELPSEARALFAQGETAYQEARYEDAITLFLAAFDKEPHPELLLNVGQAAERLGQVARALRWYREFVRLSPKVEDREAVGKRIRNLERRLLERGMQQVTVLSSPAGATVTLDGNVAGITPWTGELPPGAHRLLLSRQGYPDTVKEFVLSPERAMDIDVDMRSHARAASATTTPAARDESPSALGRVSPPTWVALGVGTVGLLGAAGYEVARRNAEEDARENPTQIGYSESYERMQDRKTTARILLAVGAGAALVGGTLLYFDLGPPGTHENAGATRLAVGWSPAGCELSAKGTF
jgi:tetratricopeptide (TPR) repeat protein